MEKGKIIAVNKRARHEYLVLETFEAGIALNGSEVKSIRAGGVNIKEAFAKIENAELFIHGMHINPYEQAGSFNHDPLRIRKLLLHKREIKRLIGQTSQKGLTLVPLRIYFKGGRAKIEIALAKGKKLYDKRDAIKKKVMNRETEKALKQHRKGI
ncbi:SsrA-binding protein SmpB [bacterium]|nr:SsrA-binding protein SmpB [bacterium]